MTKFILTIFWCWPIMFSCCAIVLCRANTNMDRVVFEFLNTSRVCPNYFVLIVFVSCCAGMNCHL